MARPRIYHEERVVTAVRLPISLRDRMDAAANAHNQSLTALVTRAVTDYLDASDPGCRSRDTTGAPDLSVPTR